MHRTIRRILQQKARSGREGFAAAGKLLRLVKRASEARLHCSGGIFTPA